MSQNIFQGGYIAQTQQNTGPSIRITSFVIVETPSYSTQFRRPFAAQINGKDIEDLNNLSMGSNTFTTGVVARAAANMILPMAQAESNIVIVNGWDTRRMRWIMTVEKQDSLGQVIIEKIVGYTDHAGITGGGALDPNMVFYVDGVTTCTKTTMVTPTGYNESWRVADASTVIADNNFQGINYGVNTMLIRPTDVFATVANSHLTGSDGNEPLVATGINTPQAKLSNVSNSNPTEFMSSILTNYTNSKLSQGAFGEGSQEVLIHARSTAADKRANQVSFLKSISQIRGGEIGNVFTYNNLIALDPNVQYVTKPIVLGMTERANTNYVGQTQNWDASDLETQMASMLSSSVTGMLAKLGLSKVTFTSTNRVLGGNTITAILDIGSYSDEDYSQIGMLMRSRIETELLPIISRDNQIDFNIMVNSELTGDTFVRISLLSGPDIDYVTPSYCSGITAPVITANRNLVQNMGAQMGALFNYLGVNEQTPSSYPSDMLV